MDLQTRKLKVQGLVQGIGFRPYVAELAESLELTGQVKNLGGMVEIIIHGDKQAVDTFIHRLHFVSKELPGCRIDHMETTLLEDGKGDIDKAVFSIVESGNTRERRRFLPVDMATCERCNKEMHDASNRRYRHPFISCTACGPRFSIQKQVPYDRESITMDVFDMCETCYEEYTQKGNIRRHAQTIACPSCGPTLFYKTSDEAQEKKGEDALAKAIEDLKQGKIGAIKDIGGFHFAFLPEKEETARRLRAFKNRDNKPFAVMFLNIEQVREYCEVSEKEEELLLSSARPIVLLQKKEDFPSLICGGSDRIGALLPCNPLQTLLLEETGPLVMTSGNRGGEPIIIDEDEMQQYLSVGIDFMLTHDRQILTPLDDSIYQTNGEYIQVLRRARGLVPDPIEMKRALSQDTLAAGGDLKATFAIGRKNMAYMSQYFGDLDDVRCADSRKKAMTRMQELLAIKPTTVVCDMHPAYVSSIEARQLVEEENLLLVQHHHAHIASVIAEHGLMGKVLGIACDGTGFGTDGTIWGSECLLCEDDRMQRVGHFSKVKLVGANASAKHADMTLFSYMCTAREQGLDVEEFFAECHAKAENSTQYTIWEQAWKNDINTAYSTSMGRLFDAMASLLNICHYNSYEGECAITLEQVAQKKGARPIPSLQVDCRKIDGVWQANGVKLLVDIWHLRGQYSKEILAYLFHYALAKAIAELAERIGEEHGVDTVALSGGTFLNRILTSEVIQQMKANGKCVYINEKVPCGDGGIALGQMYLATYKK